MTTNAPAIQVERHACPKCDAPAGSPCSTTTCKVAASQHTGRFALVPALKAELTVKTPADRNPGKAWPPGAPVPQAPDAIPGAAIRLGYARGSTVGQELQSQLDMKARTLAREIKAAAPNQPVILTVVEMKRLARSAALGIGRATLYRHLGESV
ncbi:hypothetical protein ACFTZI_16660 [Streptomyces decoyicus]|uniref:zinc finger domain-containing protein n=1 Tax=Streptomyces decoyicus TaxID=249567 RepID=UPI00363D7962